MGLWGLREGLQVNKGDTFWSLNRLALHFKIKCIAMKLDEDIFIPNRMIYNSSDYSLTLRPSSGQSFQFVQQFAF